MDIFLQVDHSPNIFSASICILLCGFLQVSYTIPIFLLFYKQLFAADEDETDLSNNFVVKTCQKFIPVTGNYLVFLCI